LGIFPDKPGWLFTNIVVSYTYRSRKFCRATKVVATIRSIHETDRIARLSYESRKSNTTNIYLHCESRVWLLLVLFKLTLGVYSMLNLYLELVLV